jgi:putative ABC transport system permease protein
MIGKRDLIHAWSSLSKAKIYAATIVLTLGFTLGTLVSMFNLNYQLLVKALPYPDGEKLYVANPNVYRDGHLEFSGSVPLPALIEAYKSPDDYVLTKALFKRNESIIADLLHTPKVNLAYVTPEFLQLLDAPVSVGRLFAEEESIYSNNPKAILSYSIWVNQFNRDPDILGKSIELEKNRFKIVGVLSPKFVEPELDQVGHKTDIWLPWDYVPLDDNPQHAWGRFRSGQYIVGKVKSADQINIIEQALNNLISQSLNNALPELQKEKLSLGFSLISYKEKILGDVQNRLVIFFAAAFTLLLIALVNITNLILARVSHQQKNLAIKAAVGAGRQDLFNEILAEILLLLVFTCLISLTVSQLEVQLIKQWFGGYLPRLSHLSFDGVSLLFLLVLSFLLVLALAFVVSQRIDYRMLNQWLQTGGKGAGIQISERLRRLLIFIQLTFTLILLAVSAQVLIQSFQHIRQPLGFSTNNIFKLSVNTGHNLSVPVGRDYHQKLLDIRSQLQTHPKIKQVSLATDVPMINQLMDHISSSADYAQLEQTQSTFVDAEYLSILKFRFVAGSNFTQSDFNSNSRKIIINETLAKRLGIDRDLSEKTVYWRNGGEQNTVVGIVSDLSLPGRSEDARMFIPALAGYNPTEIILELKPDQIILPQEINAIFARVDARYKAVDFVSLDAIHQAFIKQDFILALLTSVLALLSLSLTAVGIYGVLSYSVQLSRHELGIRMALGAGPLRILWDFIKSYLVSLSIGTVISVVFLYYAVQQLNVFNYPITLNPWSWSITVLLVFLLTMVTSLSALWGIIRKPANHALGGN